MNPFKMWMKVRAKVLVQDWKTERTMKPGETGVVVMTYAYTVQVRPEGKKLTVETTDLNAFEVIE